MSGETEQVKTVETIILRFRDLVTGPGGTIEQHDEIASSKGSVWWAWWNKPDEQVPVTVFTRLAEKIRGHADKKIAIYLYDSGQDKLYTADCLEIKWDHSRQTIESPCKDLTPDYYRSTTYYAWFKLSNINQVAQDLSGFSYVHIEEFFGDRIQDGYKEFSQKCIHSTKELQQQNRTVWFIRPSKTTDKHHYIQLLDANRITPSDFPQTIQVSAGHKLLWMSDLHFSVDGHHGYPDTSTMAKDDLWSTLRSSVQDFQSYAGALVSGDITWKADTNEYEKFKDFAGKVIREVCRGNSHFLTICPGNHDLSLDSASSKEEQSVQPTLDTARKNYEEMYRAIHYLSPNEHLCCGRRYVLNNGIPVEVISLNSSTLQQYKDAFQGQGFIGEAQLTYAAKQLGWTTDDKPPNNGAFRIVMLHHHLLPVHHREMPNVQRRSSTVYDANAVLSWSARNKVNLILHGHQHEPFCSRISWPTRENGSNSRITGWHDMHVVGLGSTGVEVNHAGEIRKNTVGIISFERNEAKVSIHSIAAHKHSLSEIWSITVPNN